MNTLATLQEPDSGTVRLGAIDVLKNKQELRRRLGYLPQEFGVYAGVSAEKMLDYLAQLKGISDRRARQNHVGELLALVNLSHERKRAVDTFSGGMRQRFGIAQALIGNPDFIIVDEPTAGLDPAERNRFHRVLSEIGENTIVLLSTHIVEDVTNLCSHFAIMNGGQILRVGTPAELMQELAGKIWQKTVQKADATTVGQNHDVIATRISSGKTVLVVRADEKPGEGFAPKPLDLEDVYFTHVPQAIESH
jgi:ABC-type multidrug transport system ATPase subunit